MTDLFWKIAAAALTAAVLMAVLRKTNGATALVISLGVCAVLAASGAELFRSVRDELISLRDAAGLRSETLSTLMKICAVGLLTQFSEAFCRESGSMALGKIVDLCGSVAALYLSMPLLHEMLEILRRLLGG